MGKLLFPAHNHAGKNLHFTNTKDDDQRMVESRQPMPDIHQTGKYRNANNFRVLLLCNEMISDYGLCAPGHDSLAFMLN